VRSADEYFDAHSAAGHFEPDEFETALIDLINQKRAGKPITA
jgi:hypothetical protein